MNEVIKKEPTVLAAAAKPSEELLARVNDVRDNLQALDNAKLPRFKMTADGAQRSEDEEPLEEISGIILHVKKTNVYYKDTYKPGEVTQPTCFSKDGIKPDASVKEPQHATCAGCPQAEFGTNRMGKGKACRNLQPIFIVSVQDGEVGVMPRQLTLTPTSLKAIRNYLMDLAERGLNYRAVETKILFEKENKNDTFVRARFKLGQKVPAEKRGDIEYLRNAWLPIMNDQQVEQADFDQDSASETAKPVVADSKGEF